MLYYNCKEREEKIMTVQELAKKYGLTGIIHYEESDKYLRIIKNNTMYIYKKETKETLRIHL